MAAKLQGDKSAPQSSMHGSLLGGNFGPDKKNINPPNPADTLLKMSPRSPGDVRKHSLTRSGDSPETSRTVPRLFGHILGFFGISGPEGSRDPYKGRAGS